MSSLSKRAALFAAAGLAISPIAAQAGTRAEASPVTIDVQRAAPGTVDANGVGRFNPAWLLLLLAVIAALIAGLSGGRTRGG